MPDSYSAGDVRPGGALPPVSPGALKVSRGIDLIIKPDLKSTKAKPRRQMR